MDYSKIRGISPFAYPWGTDHRSKFLFVDLANWHRVSETGSAID